MASWAKTYCVRVTGRDERFWSVNLNASTKLHRDGVKCKFWFRIHSATGCCSLPTYPIVLTSLYLPICMSVCPPARPATHLSVYLSVYLHSCCFHLEHRVSVKRFVSLQCLNPKTVGRTPWTVARPLPTYKHRIDADKHSYLEWDSNPRSQCMSERSHFMP
jgi:hypothetical protein